MSIGIRPIWMTREQREGWESISMALHLTGHDTLARMLDEQIIGAYDAAPAYPAEAIESAMLENARASRDFRSNRGFALAVLACLGCALPRNEDHA